MIRTIFWNLLEPVKPLNDTLFAGRSPDLNPLDYRLCSELEKMDATEHTLTWEASNNLWSEQLSAFLKECCVLLLMAGHGD
ncbi:unnamed protein product [Nezara viridula]|uniref:Uncharacterized protein n=1 Tax=Nezara viridula TaxID=85310 RepID=A0A9P0MM67_NEZVI|nr:unnamed protein product [Nezara viridula]